MNVKEKLYRASPFFIKRLLADAEAVRRNYYRRSDGYEALLDAFSKSNPMITGIDEAETVDRLNGIIGRARESTDFYKDYDYTLSDISDLSMLPLMRKDDVRNSGDKIRARGAGPRELQAGATSGSTGTPVSFYTDKKSLTHSRAYLDAFKLMCGQKKGMNCARLSGVLVVPQERRRPPYWLYIDVYRQLQCSALHIDKNTASAYFEVMSKRGIRHGNGYPSGWLFLAQAARQAGIPIPRFGSIITDSEGISPEEQDFVESAYGCRVSQTYGLSEVDTIAVMCPERNYHIFPGRCVVEITDDEGRQLPAGIEGNIVVTDLDSENFPYIRYVTGDLGIMGGSACACGWKSPYLSSVVGRVDDYVLKKDGRKIGRLSHIMKPAKNVVKSQLIQTSYDSLLIRVVPGEGFDGTDMAEVIEGAERYLGDMHITWERADELERTKAGKIKYIVRKIDECER